MLKLVDYLDNEANEFLDLISANVVKARKEKGYSQLKLATEIGYSSASYFGRMEIRKNGEHFNLVHLYKISKVLEIPVCELLTPSLN
ncbi:helix-turn-helix domain-containing protein [Malaciobacter pacificus]|uniref:helix-turn-helix domain-containing protein n=1 Tax=Malaciobacter pacificus TaxID=1080223 RepID=UPI001D18A0BA|nr:helix-turn-helix transcriptional regulator [Malaciobacter pacificus]